MGSLSVVSQRTLYPSHIVQFSLYLCLCFCLCLFLYVCLSLSVSVCLSLSQLPFYDLGPISFFIWSCHRTIIMDWKCAPNRLPRTGHPFDVIVFCSLGLVCAVCSRSSPLMWSVRKDFSHFHISHFYLIKKKNSSKTKHKKTEQRNNV